MSADGLLWFSGDASGNLCSLPLSLSLFSFLLSVWRNFAAVSFHTRKWKSWESSSQFLAVCGLLRINRCWLIRILYIYIYLYASSVALVSVSLEVAAVRFWFDGGRRGYQLHGLPGDGEVSMRPFTRPDADDLGEVQGALLSAQSQRPRSSQRPCSRFARFSLRFCIRL